MKHKNYEKILRNIKCEPMLLNHAKRVETFKGQQAYDALKKENVDANEIFAAMNGMIAENVIFRASVSKEEGGKNCTVTLAKKFSVDDTYVWAREPSKHLSVVLAILILLLCLSLVMFQLWPQNLKRMASYAAYPVLGFIAMMVVLSIIRLIIFGITFFSHSPGIWLFPNLFADVGFFASFVPVWEYHGVDTRQHNKDK
jgi:translocation protein SEC62